MLRPVLGTRYTMVENIHHFRAWRSSLMLGIRKKTLGLTTEKGWGMGGLAPKAGVF